MCIAEVKELDIILTDNVLKRIDEVCDGKRKWMDWIIVVRNIKTYKEDREAYILWNIVRDKKFIRVEWYRCPITKHWFKIF